MLIPPVSGQGSADCLDRRMATNVAHFRQRAGRAFPSNNGPDDPHARNARDVGNDVMKLHVHLHQRLLHVLDMGRGIFDQTLALPEVSEQTGGIIGIRILPQHTVLKAKAFILTRQICLRR
jgi:hypothetical protein